MVREATTTILTALATTTRGEKEEEGKRQWPLPTCAADCRRRRGTACLLPLLQQCLRRGDLCAPLLRPMKVGAQVTAAAARAARVTKMTRARRMRTFRATLFTTTAAAASASTGRIAALAERLGVARTAGLCSVALGKQKLLQAPLLLTLRLGFLALRSLAMLQYLQAPAWHHRRSHPLLLLRPHLRGAA